MSQGSHERGAQNHCSAVQNVERQMRIRLKGQQDEELSLLAQPLVTLGLSGKS